MSKSILGFLMEPAKKKSEGETVKKKIMFDGQLVEVDVVVHAETKKRPQVQGRIRGKQVHDAKLTEHLGEDEMAALEMKIAADKKKNDNNGGGILGSL